MNNLKNSLEFHFHNGTVMGFDLSQMNADNYDKVAEAIITLLGRKLQLLDCKFAKYIKKSNVLPNRQFDVKMFISGRLVDSCLSLKDIQPAALRDLDALKEKLWIMFFDVTNEELEENELLSLTSEINLN